MLVDVVDQFERIPRRVRASALAGTTKRYLGAHNAIDARLPRAIRRARITGDDYTGRLFTNAWGVGEHFQGIQRWRDHVVVSGGVKPPHVHGSQLLFFKMGSQRPSGPWSRPAYGPFAAPNQSRSFRDPHPDDVIVGWIDIDRSHWHAGGIQVADDVVVVPIYGNPQQINKSEIRFYDLRDSGVWTRIRGGAWGRPDYATPALASLFKGSLTNPFEAKAVGVTRLPPPDERWLLVLWDDTYLHFHTSRSGEIRDGFEHDFTPLHRSAIGAGFLPSDAIVPGTYQCINLVTGTDGFVYLIAGRNSQKASPRLTGEDWLDLYRISWWASPTSADFISRIGSKPLTRQRHRQMFCYDQQCNFGAGIGVYVEAGPPPHGDARMWLYAVSHWLHDGNRRLNFNEYAPAV